MRKLLLLILLAPVSCFSAPSVVPAAAVSLDPIELGSAALLFMPDYGTAQSITWDFRNHAPHIIWLTPGYKTEKKGEGRVGANRVGLLRVNVRGEPSTVLKQKKAELAWSVIYSAEDDPKLGVEVIEISPGTPDDICFGTLYGGCDFDPIPSFALAGISAKEICRISSAGQWITGFMLSHPKKQDTLVRLVKTEGSGGSSASLELLFSASREELCVWGDDNLTRAANSDLKRHLSMLHTTTLACIDNMLTKEDGRKTAACDTRQSLMFDIWEQIEVQIPKHADQLDELSKRCESDSGGEKCRRQAYKISFARATLDRELSSAFSTFLDDLDAFDDAFDAIYRAKRSER